jgi:NitT/TauT family transport system ATP-binding protein
VFLSDRVLVLSSRPGHIVHEAIIDLPKPRSRDVAYSAEFIAHVDVLRRKIER